MARETSATGWKTEAFNADEDTQPANDGGEAPDLWKDATKPADGPNPFLAPDIEEELEDDGPPEWLGIRWRDIDDTDRAAAWTGLRQWVDWFIREYNITTSQIPPCWYEHADMTAELYAGMCAEYKTWEEGAPGLAPMTTWHPHVAAMKARLDVMVSDRQCTATKQHVPDPDDLPFTYDAEGWAHVREGVTAVTELPRTDTTRWWRPTTGTGKDKITGEEILVGGTREPGTPEISGTTLLSGAAAQTFQARHTTTPGAETYWEHTIDRDAGGWTRHKQAPERTAQEKPGSQIPGYIPEEEAAQYTPEALDILDRLGKHVRAFHDGPYYLPDDSPLPKWFLSAVSGVKNRGIEAGWPQFGRYWDPVDWEALVRDHPEDIRFVHPGDAELLSGLRQWSRSEGLAFDLDVDVYINEDATIGVQVCSLCFRERPAPVQQSHVKALMTSNGRLGYWSEGNYLVCGCGPTAGTTTH